MRILLVEDDETIVLVVSELLAAHGLTADDCRRAARLEGESAAPAIDPAMVAGKLPGATQAEFRQAMVPPYAPPPPLPPQVNLLDKGREAVKDGAGALLRKAVDQATPEHLRNAKEAVEFVMRLDAWTRKLMDVLEPQHLTSALSDRNPAGALRTMAALERVSAEAADLSGQDGLLFRRNSLTGAVEAVRLEGD